MAAASQPREQPSARARNRRASPAALRERILNAAEDCFGRTGLAGTTVEEIAAAAQVSRATLYRQFPSRDDIVLGVLLREFDRIAGQLLAELRRYDTIEDVITEGLLMAVRTIRDHPRLSLFASPTAVGLTAQVAGDSEAVFLRARAFGRAMLDGIPKNARPGIRAELSIDEVADHLVRTVFGFIVLPSPTLRTEAEQRRYIRRFVIPALVESGP